MAKILIVEDDTFLSSILRDTLKKGGFDAVGAFNGSEASEKARTWKPDLVLLDILLPPTDGFAVLEDIRNDPAVANTRVIILSNVNSPEYVERAKKMGVVDYMVKVNTTPESILTKLKSMDL